MFWCKLHLFQDFFMYKNCKTTAFIWNALQFDQFNASLINSSIYLFLKIQIFFIKV